MCQPVTGWEKIALYLLPLFLNHMHHTLSLFLSLFFFSLILFSWPRSSVSPFLFFSSHLPFFFSSPTATFSPSLSSLFSCTAHPHVSPSNPTPPLLFFFSLFPFFPSWFCHTHSSTTLSLLPFSSIAHRETKREKDLQSWERALENTKQGSPKMQQKLGVSEKLKLTSNKSMSVCVCVCVCTKC